MSIIPTLFLKVVEEPVIQEIQAHKTPASNQRISKYDSTHIRKKKNKLLERKSLQWNIIASSHNVRSYRFECCVNVLLYTSMSKQKHTNRNQF